MNEWILQNFSLNFTRQIKRILTIKNSTKGHSMLKNWFINMFTKKENIMPQEGETDKLKISFCDSLFQLLKVPCIICWILSWTRISLQLIDHRDNHSWIELKVTRNITYQLNLFGEPLSGHNYNYQSKKTVNNIFAALLWCCIKESFM